MEALLEQFQSWRIPIRWRRGSPEPCRGYFKILDFIALVRLHQIVKLTIERLLAT